MPVPRNQAQPDQVLQRPDSKPTRPCASMTAPARGATPISRATSSTACRPLRRQVDSWRAATLRRLPASYKPIPGHSDAPVPPSLQRQTPAGQAGQSRHPTALRPPGHHHPRDGVHRHPRKPRPRAAQFTFHASRLTQPRRPILRRQHPRPHHPRVRPRRSRPRPRHHPGQHQPPGERADDHRAQLPGEDQRQHRQLRGRLQHRGRSREDALGGQVGRGHGHGPFHRQEHPRDPRMDHPQLARAHRHGADLPGAGEGGRQSRGTDLGNAIATR